MKRKIVFCMTVCIAVLTFAIPVMAEDANKDTHYAQGLAGFIERLFVPDDDYFITELTIINDRINAKLGGIAYLYQIVNNFFKSLNMADSSAVLNFSLPDNYFFDGFRGFSYNIFAQAGAYIGLIRNVFGVFIALMTAISCYHKLRKFFIT